MRCIVPGQHPRPSIGHPQPRTSDGCTTSPIYVDVVRAAATGLTPIKARAISTYVVSSVGKPWSLLGVGLVQEGNRVLEVLALPVGDEHELRHSKIWSFGESDVDTNSDVVA